MRHWRSCPGSQRLPPSLIFRAGWSPLLRSLSLLSWHRFRIEQLYMSVRPLQARPRPQMKLENYRAVAQTMSPVPELALNNMAPSDKIDKGASAQQGLPEAPEGEFCRLYPRILGSTFG